MPRGYRLFIIAALGFVALYGFGLGYYHAALNYPQEQRYQPYRAAADKIADIDSALPRPANAKPFQYRTPCNEPKGKDESDLCAQWRAANAGEDSAFWAQWGFWIAAVGSGLLLWQIILTRQALEDTGDATQAMIDQNEKTDQAQRAWIMPSPDFQNLFVKDGVLSTHCIMSYTNAGSTVAKSVGYFAAYWPTTPFSDND
jgi:hypothetical protein